MNYMDGINESRVLKSQYTAFSHIISAAVHSSDPTEQLAIARDTMHHNFPELSDYMNASGGGK